MARIMVDSWCPPNKQISIELKNVREVSLKSDARDPNAHAAWGRPQECWSVALDEPRINILISGLPSELASFKP